MKKIRIVLLLMLIYGAAFSQSDSLSNSKKKTRERFIGFNMTGLAAELIPFNAINPYTTGPVNLTSRFFSGRFGYRFGIGVNINDGNNTTDNLHLNVRNGYEFRRAINEHWYISHGIDLMFSFGNLNLPGNTRNDIDVLVGLAPFWGIEYKLGKHISISTETSLFCAVSSSSSTGEPEIIVKFIPPIAFFINLKR